MEKSSGAFFLSWPESFQAGVEAAGGKGWNLGRLERYGFNVPTGGILSAGAHRSFVEENNLLEDMWRITQNITIVNIGDKENEQKLFLLREKIKAGRIPSCVRAELEEKLRAAGILGKPVAVRSSATAEDSGKASFAGIHESFLNVHGFENILSAVKECYASLWAPRAVAYRRKMDVKDDKVIPAVVIMEMVEAEAAGVSFTCDPGTGQEFILVISANYGLGESVVGGAVEPDEYRMNLAFEITQKRIGRKEGKTIAKKDGGTVFVQSAGSAAGQVLSDENISRLGMLIQRVFDSLGGSEQHQDIEWVFDGKDFALVQARPVTALPRYTFDEIKNQQDIWSNAQARDTAPMVMSTLNWSWFKLSEKFRENTTDVLDCEIPPGLRYIRLYQGRLYLNMSMQQWIFYNNLGITPRQLNEGMGGHQPEIEINEKKPYRGIKGIKRLGRLVKLISRGLKTIKGAQKSFDRVNSYTRSLLMENFKDMTEKDLLKKITEIKNVFIEYYPVFLSCVGCANIDPLVKTLEKYFPGKGKAYANTLMAGKGDITSAEQGYRLVELAETARGDAGARRFFSGENYNPPLWEKELTEESPFKKSFRNFLAEYGHRGVYEMDLINPRWREDPSYPLSVIRSTMETADLGKIKSRQKEKVDEVWQEINRKVPSYRRGSINRSLKQAVKGMGTREMSKSVLVKITEFIRLVFKEMGRRLAGRGILADPADIFHCACAEIFSVLQGDWDGRVLDILVAERKARMKEMEKLSPPDIIMDETPHFAEPATRVKGNALAGIGVTAGRAAGTARIIYHPDEGEKLRAGDVLVAPSTDPGWTPLFLRASAIVVETGGIGSHSTIVAREYGLPAVINIPGVMKIIKDSQLITVDGDEGKVYI